MPVMLLLKAPAQPRSLQQREGTESFVQ